MTTKRLPKRPTIFIVVTSLAACAAATMSSRGIAADDKPGMVPTPSTRPAAPANRIALDREMKTMESCLKKLKSQGADSSKKDENLLLVAQLEQATMSAKTVIPKQITRKRADEQAKLLPDYRHIMISLLREELDLEQQIIEGDVAKVAATIDGIYDLRKGGHEELGVRE